MRDPKQFIRKSMSYRERTSEVISVVLVHRIQNTVNIFGKMSKTKHLYFKDQNECTMHRDLCDKVRIE